MEWNWGTKSVILPTKNEVFTRNHSDVDMWHWHEAVTRDIDTWQSMSEVNGHVQIELPRPILQGFIKLGDQICELNYRKTKSVIEDKVRDQFYNFAYYF